MHFVILVLSQRTEADMEAMFQTLLDKMDQFCIRIGRLEELIEGRRKSNFTVKEVAKLTERSEFTVRTHWIGKGLLRAEKLNGGKLLINAEELERSLSSAKLGPATLQSVTVTRTLRFKGPVRYVRPYNTRLANIRAFEQAQFGRDW